jgi:hypothetical protein
MFRANTYELADEKENTNKPLFELIKIDNTLRQATTIFYLIIYAVRVIH